MCRTYGRITVALDLFRVSGLLVGLDWLLMNFTGYLLLFRAWGDDSFYSSVTFVYHGKGMGRGRGEGGKRWEEGGGEKRGGERDGAIICRNDCRKTFVCVLIIANLQTCLATTHKQNSMLIIMLKFAFWF